MIDEYNESLIENKKYSFEFKDKGVDEFFGSLKITDHKKVKHFLVVYLLNEIIYLSYTFSVQL